MASQAGRARRASEALRVNAAGVKGPARRRLRPCAAGRRLREQRRQFISIEANADGVTYTGASGNIYTGPTLTASWYDAAGNRWASGLLDDYTDPDVNPDYTSTTTASSGSATRRQHAATVASIKIASNNGDVDTLAAKVWIERIHRPLAEPSRAASSTATTTR